MELFKALKEKKYSEIMEYCKDKIADNVAGRIHYATTKYLNGLRGISEDTEIIIKKDSDDEDDHEKAKETNKDGEGDKDDGEEAHDSEDGDKKKNESVEDDSEDDKAPKSKKSQKKVTTKDAKKFADADS